MVQFYVYQSNPLKIDLVETLLPGQCGIVMSTADLLTAMPTEDAKALLDYGGVNMRLALSMARISEMPDRLEKHNQMDGMGVTL